MMDFDCILVNGDSYSAGLRRHAVYADHLGHIYGLPVLNYAALGSNNDRITRSTIEHVTHARHQARRPLVIVGWSAVRRQEVWYYGDRELNFPDTELGVDPKFITLDFLLSENIATLEQRAMLMPAQQVHKAVMDLYTQMYLLAQWLESQDLCYLFFSAARNTDCAVECFPYLNNLEQVQWCRRNVMIHQLHEFCIPDWALENDPDHDPVTAHLSRAGHEKFADFLHNLLGDKHGSV